MTAASLPAKHADLDRIGKAFQEDVSSLLKRGGGGFGGGGGEHNLSGTGDGRDTRSQVYATPRVLTSGGHRSVGVHTDPEHRREPVFDAVSGQAPLQRDGAADRVLGAVECSEHAVARSVHQFAAVLRDEAIDQAIVPLQEMAPRLITDRRHQCRRIADVGEHERPRGRVARRTGRHLRRSPGELIAKRSHFGRWTDPDLLFQPTGKIRVRLDRFCQVPASGEGHHEISIAALAQRLPGDEAPCRALRRDQLIPAEAEARGGGALERSQLDVAQVTPLGVNPGSMRARQERSSRRVQGNARSWPRRRPLATCDGRFGSVNCFGGSLDVHECIAAEPELDVRAQFQMVPEDPAQPSEETAHVIVGIGGRLLGPERSDQFRRLPGRQPVDYQVGEQDALIASGQTLIYAATVHDRRQATAKLNPVSLRVRRPFVVAHGDVRSIPT